MIWNLLGAFVGYAAIDYIFVHFTLATVSNRVFLSGITASALVGPSGDRHPHVCEQPVVYRRRVRRCIRRNGRRVEDRKSKGR